MDKDTSPWNHFSEEMQLMCWLCLMEQSCHPFFTEFPITESARNWDYQEVTAAFPKVSIRWGPNLAVHSLGTAGSWEHYILVAENKCFSQVRGGRFSRLRLYSFGSHAEYCSQRWWLGLRFWKMQITLQQLPTRMTMKHRGVQWLHTTKLSLTRYCLIACRDNG